MTSVNSRGEAAEKLARSARFVGTIAQAWFTTSADLTRFLPSGLRVDDPHRAFLKVYELKNKPLGSALLQPAFSQYTQVSVTVMASPGGKRRARHHNLFMWEGRGWAMATGGLAWNKKLAEIEITRLFGVEELYRDNPTTPYRVDVTVSGYPVVTLDGELDDVARIEPPPLNGFYLEGEDRASLYELLLDDSYLGPPRHGSGTLRFDALPNESASLPPVLRDVRGRAIGHWTAGELRDVVCEGLVVQDVMFLRDFANLTVVEPIAP